MPNMTPVNEPRHDKTNKMSVRPAKTQICLGIRPVWSEFSLCAQWVVKDPSFLHADSEDSDQTGRMPRLICVFAGRKLILLVLSCRGSNCRCLYKSINWFWAIWAILMPYLAGQQWSVDGYTNYWKQKWSREMLLSAGMMDRSGESW